MSRIGKKIISIPSSVSLTIEKSKLVVKGPKGELVVLYPPVIELSLNDGELSIKRKNNQRQTVAFHGLIRSLMANAVEGVTNGFEKTLKLVGTGYRVQAKGTGISLSVGYSHPVEFMPASGITVKVEGTDTIHVSGIDKEAVGQTSANIRAICPPESYKGKGIRYENEYVKIKPGKTATA